VSPLNVFVKEFNPTYAMIMFALEFLVENEFVRLKKNFMGGNQIVAIAG
jgi:hypothetical protein